MYSSLRDFGPTWQTFWGCDETDNGGVLGVRINGTQDFTGSTLAAADDYTGTVTVTGLTKGTHTYQMLLDGVAVGSAYSFTTGPEPGDICSIVYTSDGQDRMDEAFDVLMTREPDLALFFGTENYYNDSGTRFGGSLYTGTQDLLTASNPTEYGKYLNGDGALYGFRDKYRGSLSVEPNRHLAMNTWPTFNNPHNHDINAGLISVPGEVRYDAAHKAMFEYPNAGHPETTGDIDSAPDPVLYFDKVIGDIHMIVTDMITYSEPFGSGKLNEETSNWGAHVTPGDNKQKAWLQNVLATSTSKFIVLFNSTSMISNNDITAVLTTINGLNKTIVVFAGNFHTQYARKIGRNLTTPMYEFGVGPMAGQGNASYYTYPFAEDSYDYHFTRDEVTTVGSNYASGTTLNVASSAAMRVGCKVAVVRNDAVIVAKTVASVVSPTQITVDSDLGGAADAGKAITVIDWPTATDIDNETPYAAWACYAKITSYPNGSPRYAGSHLHVQILGTFYNRIWWEGFFPEGSRVPVRPRRVGGVAVGAP